MKTKNAIKLLCFIVALVGVFALSSCDTPECRHEWTDATCTAPRTCEKCRETEGEPIAHTGGSATCTKKAVCDTCDNEYGELAKHDFKDATCTAPKTCKNCPATEGEPIAHTGGSATCTKKAVCDTCHNEYGELAKHDFKDATCTAPKTCKNCPATDGGPLEHSYVYTPNLDGTHKKVCIHDANDVTVLSCSGGNATCISAAKCNYCKEKYGTPSDKHSWADPTCSEPARCTVCTITDGEPEGHSYNSSTGKCKYCDSQVSVVLFTNTPDVLINGNSAMIIFYAEITTNETVSSVYLYNSLGELICKMYDDGDYDNSRDEFSNDGVYTCAVSISVETYKTVGFAVRVNGNSQVKSNDLKINWIDKISDAQIDNMSSVDNQISNGVFTDNFDNLAIEEKKEIAAGKIDALVEENLIKESSVVYNKDTSTFTFIYESGALGAIVLEKWTPDTNIEYANPADVLPQFMLEGDAIILWSYDQAWDDAGFRSPYYSALAEFWTDKGLNTTLKKSVTVDSYKKLSDYEIIMISAYGAYYEYKVGNTRTETIPGIILSEEVTTDKDRLYAEDLVMHRIAKVSLDGATKYVILPAFWEHYYSDGGLDGSFVVSESSEFFGVDGEESSAMADAILEASAEGVVGFRNSVMSVYSRNFAATYVLAMYYGYSSEDAFALAKQLCGANDYFVGREQFGVTAYPIYKGDNVTLINMNLVNGSFESDTALEGWETEGDTRVIGKLGVLSSTDKDKMAILTTGVGSGTSDYTGSNQGSVMQQTFAVGSADRLEFDYNYVSEEPMEYVGSQYDDKFYVELVTASGKTTILTKTINNSTWYSVSGINFQGGDSSTYQTGWATKTVDLSAYQGQMVTIRFVVYDVGDSAYDSAALIDNVVLK